MRKFIIILFGGLFIITFSASGQSDPEELFTTCRNMAGEKAIYLKDFVVKFPAARENRDAPVSKNSVILSKNIKYRFTICNSEQYEGEAIIQLYDDKRMVFSNLFNDKIYPFFDFDCKKTGRYMVMISFNNGEAGEAVSIMSYIKN